ncbi:hypothetical protein L596_025945 [Steinernema carpocapsae]|uniref:Uncharacterized protein n=1 Tax=Steinernema carpocapsae TaxID=34508 RepID=A0A4U5M996_STECR|nr:hypothetical protein L596_025945 [Steinernema carpocapsae]
MSDMSLPVRKVMEQKVICANDTTQCYHAAIGDQLSCAKAAENEIPFIPNFKMDFCNTFGIGNNTHLKGFNLDSFGYVQVGCCDKDNCNAPLVPPTTTKVPTTKGSKTTTTHHEKSTTTSEKPKSTTAKTTTTADPGHNGVTETTLSVLSAALTLWVVL